MPNLRYVNIKDRITINSSTLGQFDKDGNHPLKHTLYLNIVHTKRLQQLVSVKFGFTLIENLYLGAESTIDS